MNPNDLHEKMKSSIKQERLDAITYLKHMSHGDRQFIYFPLLDLNQVWDDLHKLTSDQDSDVKKAVARTINSVFFSIPNKDQALADLIRLISDQDSDVRWTAANTIGYVFSRVSDKDKAWEDIIKLITEQDNDIRRAAASIIISIFSHVPNKEQAWDDLHKLTFEEDKYLKKVAASAIGSSFRYIPNKNQAIEDLYNLASIEDNGVKQAVAMALGSAFPYISKKRTIFKYIFKFMYENDIYVKRNAKQSLAIALSYIFEKEDINIRNDSINSLIFTINDVSDKEKAWTDFINLISDNDYYLRVGVMNTLGIVFPHVSNKDQVWKDVYKFIDKDINVNWTAAKTLCSIFPYVPNKDQALFDLIRLTSDHHFAEIWNDMSYTIANYFEVLDEELVWKSLHDMTSDQDSYIRWTVVSFIESFFPYIPDKEQAWSDLIKLTSDAKNYVRKSASSSLASVFSYIPNKNRAWRVLHELTFNKDRDIRWGVASSLGSVYSHAPDKKQVWDDLIKLASDEKNYVRMGANYSLGRVLIIMAAESTTENEYRDNLQEAINFFKRSSEDFNVYFNPSKFCLPFYHSFYIVIFNEINAKKEVGKYLIEARKEIGKSKNKEILIEAVENLANALSEVQNIENMDLETKKVNLYIFRQYCDFAANLLDDTQKSAPIATAVLKKGLPIINENLNEIIVEIQKNAEIICEKSKGKPTELIACYTNQEVQKWIISDQEEMTLKIDNLVFTLKSKIPNIPANKHIHDKIEDIYKEIDLVKQYELVLMLISLIPQTIIEGDLIMGDSFKNIQNATIINRSIVENSFNKLRREHDEKVAQALMQIAEFIDKSGDINAAILFDKFNEELNKPDTEKSTLKKLWDGIEKTLPTIATISEAIAKLAPIF